MIPIPQYIGIGVLGAVVGYASGLFGIGGGFILTPLLNACFGVPWPIAVGSGLAQMIAVGMNSAYRHGKAGFIDVRLALGMSPGIVLGALAGKLLLDVVHRLGTVQVAGHALALPNVVMNGLFAVLLLTIAVRLWRKTAGTGSTATGSWLQPGWPQACAFPASGIQRCSALSITAGGLLIGVLSGLLGIGGGVLLIPLLLYGFAVPLRIAIGSSALLILTSAIVGTVLHALSGHVDLQIVAALVVGSFVGVNIGAWHSHRLHADRLQQAFAFVVVAVALLVIVRMGS